MALTILRFNERRIGAGNGCTEVSGIAQWTTTSVTGELDCRLNNIEEIGLTYIGQPSAGLITIPDLVGSISGTTSFTVTAPRAETISAIVFTTATAITANDTSYWTFGVVNKGQAGAGTTVVVDATAAANTTKTTGSGGSGIVGYTPRSLTLSGTAGALTVAAGDVLEITVTKVSSATTMTECNARIDGTTTGATEMLYVDEAANVTTGGVLQRPASGTLTIGRTGLNPASGAFFAFRYRGF